jgi:hypothetical protein
MADWSVIETYKPGWCMNHGHSDGPRQCLQKDRDIRYPYTLIGGTRRKRMIQQTSATYSRSSKNGRRSRWRNFGLQRNSPLITFCWTDGRIGHDGLRAITTNGEGGSLPAADEKTLNIINHAAEPRMRSCNLVIAFLRRLRGRSQLC